MQAGISSREIDSHQLSFISADLLSAFSTYSHSDEETIAIGKRLGEILPANSIICFFGDLGAGKTTLIKGLALGAAEYDIHQVTSPTFSYLNIYKGTKTTIYHFDLYRLHGIDDFLSMGFEEYLFASGICCIEWSERISALLPSNVIQVKMSHVFNAEGETVRQINISHSDHNLETSK